MTREASRSITVKKLKAAALSEFARVGYAAASVDRLTEAAGYSRGAFYANYKSKQDLLFDLLQEQSAAELAEWRRLIDSAQDMEAIYAGMAARFEVYATQTEWSMVAIEVRLHARRNSAFADKYRAYVDELTESTATALAILFEKAGCHPPAPIDMLASALRSFVSGLSLYLDSGTERANENAASAMLVLYLRGLIALGTPDH